MESVKAVSDVFSPVTGTVTAVNEALLDDPAQVNEDPYGAWFIQVEQMTDEEELLDAAAYEAYCKGPREGGLTAMGSYLPATERSERATQYCPACGLTGTGRTCLRTCRRPCAWTGPLDLPAAQSASWRSAATWRRLAEQKPRSSAPFCGGPGLTATTSPPSSAR